MRALHPVLCLDLEMEKRPQMSKQRRWEWEEFQEGWKDRQRLAVAVLEHNKENVVKKLLCSSVPVEPQHSSSYGPAP